MISLALCCFILVLLAINVKWSRSKAKGKGKGHLPPGPPRIPVLGFLHHFAYGKNYSSVLIAMKARWGKICTVQMGSFKCVWLNDADLIREAWCNPAFCGRPKLHGITSRTEGVSGGLIFNDGPDAQEQRRFTLRTLRNLGFNKSFEMERLIQEQTAELVHSLRACGGVPISTRHRFNVASINALWRIVTGEKLDNERPDVKRLVQALDRNMELSPGTKLGFFIPWLTKLCPTLIGWTAYVKDANDIFNFWRAYARRRLEEFARLERTSGDRSANFVDEYISVMCSAHNSRNSETETRLALVLQDLFIAGTETTATTLCWALLYLATYPAVQEKLYAEVSDVIGICIGGSGNGNLPSLSDRARMIYTQAFIQEVLRHATLAPLGMLHSTMEDVHFHGHLIPAGTILQANICGAHRDPEYWGYDPPPSEFEPERFIVKTDAQDGKGGRSLGLALKNPGFLAFSHGKRVCLGETLARDELFVFLTSVVQAFQIDLDLEGQMSDFDLEPIIGVSAIPKPHKLIFRQRK